MVEGKDAGVTMGEAEALLGEEDARFRLWFVPLGEGGHRVDLDEEALRALRALGYIQ
jgi:hypothetical protein